MFNYMGKRGEKTVIYQILNSGYTNRDSTLLQT